MKKLLFVIFLLLVLFAAGAAGYFILNPDAPVQTDTTPKQVIQKSAEGGSQSAAPSIGAMKEKATDADILEALHYEIGKNRDTIAWLWIPNTTIDNSVVQSHDNLFYLRKNERLQEDIYGCYFADSECSVEKRDDLSQNTVIYGHSDLKDNPQGPRFPQLFLFAQEQFAQNNRQIYLVTPDEKLVWEVFSVFYTDVGFDYIKVNMTDEQKIDLAAQAIEKSIFDYQTSIDAQDKLLTLSTCSVKYGNDGSQRFVVMARLLPAQP